jgi:TPR repeat protein
MHKWRGLAVVAGVVLGTSGFAQSGWFVDAAAAPARSGPQTDTTALQPRAEQGNETAQKYLGWMFRYGREVSPHFQSAIK